MRGGGPEIVGGGVDHVMVREGDVLVAVPRTGAGEETGGGVGLKTDRDATVIIVALGVERRGGEVRRTLVKVDQTWRMGNRIATRERNYP